jgi:hypothetical protein
MILTISSKNMGADFDIQYLASCHSQTRKFLIGQRKSYKTLICSKIFKVLTSWPKDKIFKYRDCNENNFKYTKTFM